MRLELVMAALGGAAEVGALRSAGVPRRAIDNAIARGALVRIRRGCVALPDADPIRVAEVAWRGRRTCVTLALDFALPVLVRDARIHLAVDPHRSLGARHARPPGGVTFHYAPTSQAVGALAQAIDSASLCVGPTDQLVMVDAALNRRALLLDDLGDFSVTAAGAVAWLRAHADASAESPIETVARLSLRRARLRFVPQAEISGVGRVDFLVEETVVVEMDGRAHHSDPGAFARDRERDRAAAALGLTVLRFTYDDAMRRADLIGADVLAALRARARN